MATEEFINSAVLDDKQDIKSRHMAHSNSVIVHKIEQKIMEIIESLNKGELPLGAFQDRAAGTIFRKAQFSTITNMLMVMCYIHNLLLSHRTSTTREVFYFYVTHFKSQRECDKAILDVTRWLEVPRVALGLVASPKGKYEKKLRNKISYNNQKHKYIPSLPKGWISGCLKLKDGDRITDCSTLNSIHGLPITREWLDMATWGESCSISIESDAKCIVVVEKEAIYTRLTEDRVFDHHKCIIITGKGFPDIATRACLFVLYEHLNIPVYGLCDCNPFGFSVLMTYWKGSSKLGIESNKYSVPIQWLGLRPSQVEDLNDELPGEVFQSLSDLDYRRLATLMNETCTFTYENEDRVEEIAKMHENGWKMELESLQWFGLEFLSKWLISKIQDADVI